MLVSVGKQDGAAIGQVQRYAPDATDFSPVVKALGTGMDAVLLPEGGNRVRVLAPLLAYHDIDPAQVNSSARRCGMIRRWGSSQPLVGGGSRRPIRTLG